MDGPLVLDREGLAAMAAELARLTGTSLEDAVGEALEAQIRRLKQSDRDARLERINAYAREMREYLDAHGITSDRSGLYDDDGLPA